MKQRLISAAVMIAIGLPCLVWGGIVTTVFLYAILVGVDYEIAKISGKLNVPVLLLLILFDASYFYLGNDLLFLPAFIVLLFIIGIFDENFKADLICVTGLLNIACLIAIDTAITCFSIHRLFLIFVALVGLVCDGGAYFVGRSLGKHKLCERISPKKTVEGAIGGIVVSFIVSLIFVIVLNFFGLNKTLIIVLIPLIAIVSEIGDLSFSLIKRHFNIKDFSNLIPGHGGLLDRFDSCIICLLFVNLIIKLFIL